MSIRTEKVASEIKKALSQRVSDFAHANGGGMITVTTVNVTADLAIAKVNVSVFANSMGPESILRMLNASTYLFKADINKKVRLRITPNIIFFLDDSLDKMDKISTIIQQHPPIWKASDEDAADTLENGDNSNGEHV